MLDMSFIFYCVYISVKFSNLFFSVFLVMVLQCTFIEGNI